MLNSITRNVFAMGRRNGLIRSNSVIEAIRGSAGASLVPRHRSNALFLAARLPIQAINIRTKVSERAQRRKQLRKMKKNVEQVPLLKDTLKKLYLRTHPDLFGAYPEQQQQNDSSYKELMGILTAIEKDNQFPPAKTLVLPFYLKTPVEGQFKKVSLHLKTTGGACHTLVELALCKFFEDCGLPSVFRWSDGSWGRVVGKDAVQNPNLEYDEEKEQKPEPKSTHDQRAPAYTAPFQEDQPDNSIERVLNELNDVFQLIAAVPWLDEEEYGEIRKYYEEENGLDEIEERGYRVKDATRMIWKGERNWDKIAKGLDADSALIVQRIFMHSIDIEKQVRQMISEEISTNKPSPSSSEDK